MGVLASDPAADQDRRQGRRERHRQDRREAHGVGLGVGQGLKKPAFGGLQRKHRQERHRDDQQGKEDGRTHLLHGADHHRQPVRIILVLLQALVDVLHEDDRGVDHGADGYRDAAEGHDVGRQALLEHGDEGQEHRHRQGEDGHQRAAHAEQKEEDDQADHHHLFEQGVGQRVDGRLDQLRAVVGHLDAHPLGQTRTDRLQALLDPLDDRERVLSLPHHDDATHRLPLAVPLGEPTAWLRAQGNLRHVADQQGRTARGDPKRDGLDVRDTAQVAAAADHVFVSGDLQGAATAIPIGLLDGRLHLCQRHPMRHHAVRIELHLVLLVVAADGRDLSDAGHALERVANVPVLQSPQIGQIVAAGLVDQHVHKHPTHAGGVRTEGWPGISRQVVLNRAQVLEDAAAGPVQVGAVLEDDVDKGQTEEGLPPHIRDTGRAHQGRRDRVGDLVLHQVRAAPRPIGQDDDLGVRQVRDGVQRCRA